MSKVRVWDENRTKKIPKIFPEAFHLNWSEALRETTCPVGSRKDTGRHRKAVSDGHTLPEWGLFMKLPNYRHVTKF